MFLRECSPNGRGGVIDQSSKSSRDCRKEQDLFKESQSMRSFFRLSNMTKKQKGVIIVGMFIWLMIMFGYSQEVYPLGEWGTNLGIDDWFSSPSSSCMLGLCWIHFDGKKVLLSIFVVYIFLFLVANYLVSGDKPKND
jgi:hypothetical protein